MLKKAIDKCQTIEVSANQVKNINEETSVLILMRNGGLKNKIKKIKKRGKLKNLASQYHNDTNPTILLACDTVNHEVYQK